MRLGRLLLEYILWHYTRGFLDLWRLFANFMWFWYNVFSIPFLLMSLFAPFERMHENLSASADGDDLFTSIVANIILRIVGAILRLSISVIGICFLLITIVLGLGALVVWPLLPVVVSGAFTWGIYTLL